MKLKDHAEPNNSQHCWNCQHFQRLYTLGEQRFNKTEYGLCSRKSGHVRAIECCEKFTFNPYIPSINTGLSMRLRKIMLDLSILRNIIEETANVYNEDL